MAGLTVLLQKLLGIVESILDRLREEDGGKRHQHRHAARAAGKVHN
jgi:hypothetical protein